MNFSALGFIIIALIIKLSRFPGEYFNTGKLQYAYFIINNSSCKILLYYLTISINVNKIYVHTWTYKDVQPILILLFEILMCYQLKKPQQVFKVDRLFCM